MKTLFMVYIWAVLFCRILSAQVPEMVNGWPYGTRTSFDAVLETPLFLMENQLENSAIYYNTNLGAVNKFHFDASYYSGWPSIFDSLHFINTPVLADLDHDGESEMLAVGSPHGRSYNSFLYAFDNDGSVMPGFPLVLNWPDILNVADLDGDNEYEIISDSWDDRLIYCFDRYGASKPGWPIEMPEDYWVHNSFAASVGDLDRDGHNEIIMDGDKHIYAFCFDGSQESGFPIAIWDTSFYYSPSLWPGCLADLDNDGYLEYAVSGNNWDPSVPYRDCFVAVYDHTGQMKAGWPLFYQGFVRGGIVPADINSDGIPELGYFAGLPQVDGFRFVNSDGQLLSGWPVFPTDQRGVDRSPGSDIIVADVDGDNLPEIFMDYSSLFPDSMGHDSLWYYGHSYFFGLDHNGQQLPGYPIAVNGVYYCRPPSFAWDSSSQSLYMGLSTEVVASPYQYQDTAFLDIYHFPDSTGPLTEWPMLNHDNLHSRNYNFVDNVTAIQEGNEILPKSFILKQNYPNPFNGNTIIEFSLPKYEGINLYVYDILGRKVKEIINSRLKAGSYKETINLNSAASGVYFCVLQGEKTKITRKMMLIK